MQTRYRAAATALLLTATGGLAATGGAAEAFGTHHDRAGANPTLVITIKSKAHAVKLSQDTLRPGNTIFKVRNMAGKASKGLIQIVRFRHGYTLLDAQSDIPAAFGGDTAAVARVDDGMVFYGGMQAKGDRSKVSKWAVRIDKPGTYFVVNFDRGNFTTLTAKGNKQRRAHPKATGFINAVTSSNDAGNDFKAGKGMPHRGWMSTENKAKEPHFVELGQVKKGTTDADVQASFEGGPDPSVPGGGHAGTGVISPGHTFIWAYHVPKGRYAALCFWPSLMTGAPHGVMGMHAVFNLS
jgi:hypothetical protein